MQSINFKNLRVFLQEGIPTEEICRQHLKEQFWPDGKIVCPHCGSNRKIYEYKDGLTYKCADCKRQFSLTKGSIFEKTKIPLRDWFTIIFKFVTQKKGLSSGEVSRQIGVTQTNALYMLHRIYIGCGNYEYEKLEGIVEIDETFVGGKNRFRHHNKKKKHIQGRSMVDKTGVLGYLARGGNIKVLKVSNLEKRPLLALSKNLIKHGSTVATDEYKSYKGLSQWFQHGQCNHSAYQYVNSVYHTNTLEGAWSLFKRSIVGVHHHISKKHTYNYCMAFEFRYNTRKMDTEQAFNLLLGRCLGVSVTYKELVEKGV